MKYVESFDLFGTNVSQIACIRKSGAPTTATEGAVGCLYMDTNNGAMYKCTAVSDGVYTWEPAETGSGGGNYAPADAIVDQSLESDWISGRYDYPDTAIFTTWKWEKRLDGSFTLLGTNDLGWINDLEEDDEIYEGDIFYGEECLPFGIYDAEWTYSCEIFTDTDESIDFSDTIMLDFVVYHDIDDTMASHNVGLTITRTEEALEQLRNAGIIGTGVYTSLQITGKWRKD